MIERDKRIAGVCIEDVEIVSSKSLEHGRPTSNSWESGKEEGSVYM